MVFTSIPATYLEAANWQQQQPTHQGGNSDASPQLLPPPPPTLPPVQQPHGAGSSAGSIRPGSMADRARMANLPMPEAALKCPRCESTNTKFCYFNNYSLLQPRHFCKTCRRYWTRDGALRNVPVGGGCRRNKRSSKGSSSKSSPASSSADRPTGSTSSTNSVSSNSADMAGGLVGTQNIPPAALRFMPQLHHHHNQLTEFGTGENNMGLLNYGLSNYSAVEGDMNFQMGSAFGGSSLLSGLEQQWRMVPQTQQFPFLAGLEPSSNSPSSAAAGWLYPSFEGGNNSATELATTGYGAMMRPKVLSTSGVITQLASVKMEDNRNRELNLSNQFLGMNNINNPSSSDQQYWTSNATGASAAAAAAASANWTDLSGFSSSSTTSNNQL